MRKFVLVILLLTLATTSNSVSFGAPHESANCDWVCFLGNAEHTGNVKDACAPLTVKLGRLWQFDAGSSIMSSPAIVSGYVYFGTNNGKFFCVEAQAGKEVWEYETKGKISSSPAVYKGNVYFGSEDKTLYCLDAKDGKLKWKMVFPAEIFSSPIIAANCVYFGCNDKKLYCVQLPSENPEEEQNPAIKWSFEADGEITTSPACSGDKVLFGANVQKFYCVSADAGQLIWEIEKRNSIYASPVVFEKRVYLASSSNFDCVDLEAGVTIWWGFFNGNSSSSPAVTTDKVFLSSGGRLHCIGSKSGQKIWESDIQALSSIIYSKGKLFFGSSNKRFYFVDAQTGNAIWSFETGGRIVSSPALYNNRIYLGSDDGRLYCFGDAPSVPDKIEVNPKSASVLSGQTIQFSAKVFDQFGKLMVGEKVEWSVEPFGIGTVDQAGLFTAIKAGMCKLLATSGGVSGSSEVSVSEPPTTDCITVEPAQLGFGTVPRGKSHYMSFVVTVDLRDETTGTITPSDNWIEVAPRAFKTKGKKLEGTVTIKASTIPRGENFRGTIKINVKGACNEKIVDVLVRTEDMITLGLMVSNPKATINGNPIDLDVPPMIVGGRTLVPIRFISESFGCKVEWEAQTGRITISRHDFTVVLFRDKVNAYVNGEEKTLDVPASITQGRTLVPVRFISEAFGAQVEWNPDKRTITITWLPE